MVMTIATSNVDAGEFREIAKGYRETVRSIAHGSQSGLAFQQCADLIKALDEVITKSFELSAILYADSKGK